MSDEQLFPCPGTYAVSGQVELPCRLAAGHAGRCGPAEVVRLVSDPVNHPAHYGGADNPYEAIKVIDAWQLGFCLGNTVKYVARAGKKHKHGAPVDDHKAKLEDLKKARWYLQHEIEQLERQ